MKKKGFLAFIFLGLLLLGSCRDKSAIKDEKSECEDNSINNVSQNDSISKIMPPENDSIACFLDSVIGCFHVKHFTQNDSTELCINSYLNVGVGVDTIVHYDRKLNIYIGDGDYIFKKTITREELLNLPEMKEFKQVGDYKRMCITYVTPELKNDSTLKYEITLEERDDWSISFYYEYCNKSFVYKGCQSNASEYDDES